MDKIEKAIQFALDSHGGVKRKGKNSPYILHPLEAMLIVSKLTDDEDVIAAAVLHDTLEDTDVTQEDLRREFGDRVANLVNAESENKRRDQSSESTWKVRKGETIEHIRHASREEKLICLGDKLANLREIAGDYSLVGDALWSRFNQKDKAMYAWYYGSIYQILLQEFGPIPTIQEYGKLLNEVFGQEGGKSL